MFGVCVCVFVCCGTLKKTWKNRIWLQKRLRVSIQNVSVCTFNVPVSTGTTRTRVETCVRVVPAHTGTF